MAIDFSARTITPVDSVKILGHDGNGGYTTGSALKDYILSGKGNPNGLAELDENGKLVQSQLPDLANDVLEYDSYSVFPVVGETGKIYVDKAQNTLYRWNGSQYTSVNTDTTELEQRVDGLESDVDTLNLSSTDHGSRISDLETEVEGLESDVDEHTDRLAQYDFREVDPFEGFVLEGDRAQSLEGMVQDSEVYEQDAIMLSIEPVIPSASTHNFGIRGQIAIDDSYLYVCVADNTWKKIPLQNL